MGIISNPLVVLIAFLSSLYFFYKGWKNEPYNWIIAFILLIPLYFGYHKEMKDKEDFQSKVNATINNISDFKVDQIFVPMNLNNPILLLDESRKKIGLLYRLNEKFGYSEKLTPIIFSHTDIISADVLQDGVNVITTSRSSQIGGAIVGGVLLGGAGAVIGGLSGKKQSKTEIKTIELKIVFDNFRNPIHMIQFFPNDNEGAEAALSQARHWHGILSILITGLMHFQVKNSSPTTYNQTK